MKKLMVMIISFFMFSTAVFAEDSASKVNIDISLSKDGSAMVVEKWEVTSGKKLSRNLDSNFKITDVSVLSNKKDEYDYIKKCDLTSNYSYCTKDSYIELKTSGKKENITIIYKIKSFVYLFEDVNGLDYKILDDKNTYDIKELNVEISGDIQYNKNNTVVYGIGKNTKVDLDNDKIILKSEKVESKSKITLVATFSKDIDFEAYLIKNQKFEDFYKEATKVESYYEKLLKVTKKEIIIVIIIIAVSGIVISSITKKMGARNHKEEYRKVKIYDNDIQIPKMNEVPYYETIPCDGSLYKLNYIGGYFQIIKNRSNIIGALIFKWVCEGRCVITNNKLKLNVRMKISDPYEKMLYDLLVKASNENYIDEKRFRRYVQENPELLADWFSLVDQVVINKEIENGNIKQNKKNLVLEKAIVDETSDILGLKRYLLHFNQVPRKTQLSENTYKSLLVCSILFGIEEDLAKEILRKSSDNIFAQKLLEFNKMKNIYKGIYQEVTNKK